MKYFLIAISLFGLFFVAKQTAPDPNFTNNVQSVCDSLLVQGYDADEAVKRKSPNEERYTKAKQYKWGDDSCDIVVLATYEDTILQLTIIGDKDTLVGNINYTEGRISTVGSNAKAEVAQSSDIKIRNALEYYLENYFTD